MTDMKKLFAALMLPLLCASTCKSGEKTYEPAIRVELQSVTATGAVFEIHSVDAVAVLYGCSEGEPSLTDSLPTGGVESKRLTLEVGGLRNGTGYNLRAVGVGPGGEQGKTVTVPFTTPALSGKLYPWEKRRTGVSGFADISLVTLGRHNANPPAWTPERFASHVSCTDANGNRRWLFDAFLCLDSFDPVRGLSYTLNNGARSSVKESWEDLLQLWLGEDGAIARLDEAVIEAASEIGEPPRPRLVVMSLPDPVMLQNFADKNSSTVYWGELDGRKLDFAKPADQIAAYRWYMDSCRERFNALGLRHTELAGFYILSEELHLSPAFYEERGLTCGETETYNSRYKHWEEIVPAAAAYAHSCNEGLWWIPYNLAPGYRVWKDLGFDMAFMQPNYYWDNGTVSHPMSKTVSALRQYRMGIELEFEYTLVASVMADGRLGPDGSGNMVFSKADIPMLRSRVREYMDAYRNSGLYGELPVAVYSGTDAWHQLASSKDSGDRLMYQDICSFIIDSPLKGKH